MSGAVGLSKLVTAIRRWRREATVAPGNRPAALTKGTRARHAPEHPDLAVIVLAYNEKPQSITAAADSVLAQGVPVELLIVHSGPADTAAVLRRVRPDLRVLASRERLLPGAARNAGVAATHAPFVSFLAGDCRARAGWVAARQARHRRGALAVASTILPTDPGLPSVVSCLLTAGRRLPGIVAAENLRFGVSYDRELLDRHGPFPEELEFAEDTVMNKRLLVAGVAIESTDDVVTEHAFPTSLTGLLVDQFERGRARGRVTLPRFARAWLRLYLVAATLKEACLGAVHGARSPAIPLHAVVRGLPLLTVGALARSVGVLSGGGPLSGARAELECWEERGILGRILARSAGGRDAEST